MAHDDLKKALLSGQPIQYDGITYNCVSAIIYRKVEGGLHISAELLDRNKNSVTIVNPTKINIAEGKRTDPTIKYRSKGKRLANSEPVVQGVTELTFCQYHPNKSIAYFTAEGQENQRFVGRYSGL